MPAITLLLHTTKILKTVAYSHAIHLQHLTSSERNCNNHTVSLTFTTQHEQKVHMYVFQYTTTVLWPFFRDHRVSRCQKRTSDFMVQGKINRDRHTDHPAGRHSIRTNQCPPPPSTIFFTGRTPFLPHTQQHQSTEGNVSAVLSITLGDLE